MQTESFQITPLQAIIPSYLYEEYSDDADLQAFVASFNALAQGYLDWFNNTPLALYTSPNISGQLLDWIGQGIYGISRPVIASLTTRTLGALNSLPLNARPMNSLTHLRSGTAEEASDDLYKRLLTWILYKGDGMQVSIPWLRRRIARFLFGANGQDVELTDLLSISISIPNLPAAAALNSRAMNTQAMNMRNTNPLKARNTLLIRRPSSAIAQQGIALLQEGYIPMPFQMAFQIQLT